MDSAPSSHGGHEPQPNQSAYSTPQSTWLIRGRTGAHRNCREETLLAAGFELLRLKPTHWWVSHSHISPWGFEGPVRLKLSLVIACFMESPLCFQVLCHSEISRPQYPLASVNLIPFKMTTTRHLLPANKKVLTQEGTSISLA